jgi:quercetin dioxygenase-like cupin family protein
MAVAKSISQKAFDTIGAALVRTREIEWIGTSAGVKFLRISKETGWIAALVRGRAGQVNPAHTHLGPACFYVLEGGFDFRGGSAREGDWVWEAAGAIHPATSHPVGTVYMSLTYGPVVFYDKEGKEPKLIDFRSSQALLDRIKDNGPKGCTRSSDLRFSRGCAGADR